MSKQENLETQKKWGEALNSGNFEALRDLVAPGVIEHDPAPEQGPGAQGYIDMFTAMATAFPDMKATPEYITADEDTVALAYTLQGTHKGEFMGVAPTGKEIKIRGVQIGKFENGKLIERWGSSDQLGLLQQLGVHIQ